MGGDARPPGSVESRPSADAVAAREGAPVPLLLAGSTVLAGGVYPVTGAVLEHAPPLTVAAVRAVVGGIVLAAALPLVGARLPRGARLWGVAALIGLGNTTLTLVGISEGTSRAGAAVAAVLLNSSPFFVAVLARALLHEPITGTRAAGLVVGFAGVVAVVLADPGDVATGSDLALGLALALLGALGWACAGLGVRAVALRRPDVDVAGFTAAQFLCGGAALLPLAALDGGGTDWSSPSLLAGLAYLVVCGQVLIYVWFNAALRRWPSARIYAWSFLVPVVAVAIEAVRGELPGGLALAGIALVILGVAVVNLPDADVARAPRAG